MTNLSSEKKKNNLLVMSLVKLVFFTPVKNEVYQLKDWFNQWKKVTKKYIFTFFLSTEKKEKIVLQVNTLIQRN